MKRRTIRRFLKLIEILLCMAFVASLIVCFMRFLGAEDVYDKVDYGIWVVILLIVTIKEW